MKTCKVPPHTHRIYGYARENPRTLVVGMNWLDHGVENGEHLWETPNKGFQITQHGRNSFVLYARGNGRIGRFPTLNTAKAAARTIWLSRNTNPIDPNTRILLMGTALVGTAVAIAAILVAKKASAAPAIATASALNLEASNAGPSYNTVNVGQSVTISLETAQGQTYPTPTTLSSPLAPPGNVLGPPTRSTSTSGISDTFPVLQAGTATVAYTGTGGAPALTFNIAAAN